MTDRTEIPWEQSCADVLTISGSDRAVLAAENPYNIAAPLSGMINNLMTELWDRISAKAKFARHSWMPLRPVTRQKRSGEAGHRLSWLLPTGDLWISHRTNRKCRTYAWFFHSRFQVSLFFPKAQSGMRSVEDVCAKIEEMVSKAKGKTTTRQGAKIAASSFVLPDWNMPISSRFDHAEFVAEDAGAERRINYAAGVARWLIFAMLAFGGVIAARSTIREL